MNTLIKRFILIIGITLLSLFWFSNTAVLILVLSGKSPLLGPVSLGMYLYLFVMFLVLPWGIRTLFKKINALQSIASSPPWPAPTKPEMPSEDKDPRGWYTIIEDLGYAGEISFHEYQKIGCLDGVLLAHKKNFGVDSKDDAVEELLAQLTRDVPGFFCSYKTDSDRPYLPGERRGVTWFYQYKGDICGEPVDIMTDFSHFVPDILNPILSSKLGFELLFAFPGSDSYEFILAPSDRVEQVKANPYYWDYPLVEHWYGYTEAAPTVGIKKMAQSQVRKIS